jgi:hypothetical protein
MPLADLVIPVLVTGIHSAACSCARGSLDPGHKARDDYCCAFKRKRWILPVCVFGSAATNLRERGYL